MAQEKVLNNNLEIVEVVYQKDGEFYIQSTEGSIPSGLQASNNDAINIYRITYDKNGDLIDVYPKADDVDITAFATEIVNNNAPSGDIRVVEPNPNGITNYDDPDDTFDNNGNDPYEIAMERITAFPDVRSYWSVDNNALGTPGYQDFMTFQFYIRGTLGTPNATKTFTEPDAVFLATERNGNSPMLFTPLDEGGAEIQNSNQVEINTNDDGSANDQDYQWNTGFLNSNDGVTNQSKHLILFSNELFFADNPGASQNIYGFDIDLASSFADGSVLAFRDPQTRITVGECWRTLSSTPITGATYSELLDNIWTQGVPGSKSPPPETPSTNSNVLLWDTSTSDNNVNGWTADTLDLADEIPVGSGFLISVFADDDFDGTADDFPKILEVEGKENNSTVTPSMNGNPDGWTLLGNPYGAPLSWSDVIANNMSNTTEVAYVYDRNSGNGPTNGNSGSWLSHNGNTGDIENGLIAPFQGFFVQNDNSSSAQIEMQLDDRTSLEFASGSVNEWKFYGKSSEEQVQNIRLEVEGEGLLNSAWISFPSDGSNNRIKGDAYELTPFSEHYAMLSTRKGDELFDIGQFPYNEETIIPLNLETTLPGRYKLKITESNLIGSDLVFTDTQKNVTLPLNEDFEYEFEVRQAAKANPDPLRCGATGQELAAKFKPKKAKVTSTTDRFIIQHASAVDNPNGGGETPSQVQLNQNYPNPFNPTTQISYQLPQQSDVLLEVYDLTGKLITTLVNETVSSGTHSVTFDAANLSSGVYMYRLQTANRVLSRKLTVIK
ncbi:MAG: T9SS type A sorting domain-containing protein [Bacteroidetes bacterium]|nr:T9SS type A sorting domain-containing protein [Bacteroidota bacterium]